MAVPADTEHDVVERFSRRSLWAALAIMLVLGGFAVATLAETNLPAWTGALVSMAIALAVIVLGRSPDFPRAQRAVQQDELHRQSLALAQRDALIAVLVAQPLCAYAIAQAAVPASTALMACATVTLGAVVLLASLLWRDR